MSTFKVGITYFFNSGFVIETQKYCLIFDFYLEQARTEASSTGGNMIEDRLMQTGKKIFVFVSHSHADHFNPTIFQWQKQRIDINYILSSDIRIPGYAEINRYGLKMIAPYEELELGKVKIKAYGSTDEDVSFLVKADGLTIFHAGDLNWWYWWDDSEEERKDAEHRFKNEIAKLKGEEIDLAFFPVDPRLEHNFAAGGKYFIEELQPKVFIPMHFGEDYEIVDYFGEEVKHLETRVIKINSSLQQIFL